MCLSHNKKQITDWWIADREHILAFKNILSGEKIKGDLRVVGYWRDEGIPLLSCKRGLPILLCSIKRVVYINRHGVLTSDLTFYPFKEAHSLYLKFLHEANKPNRITAYNWTMPNSDCKIKADIIIDGNLERNVSLKWTTLSKNIGQINMYSTEYKKTIVFSRFDQKDAFDECEYFNQDSYGGEIPENMLDIDEAVSLNVRNNIYITSLIDKYYFAQMVKESFKKNKKVLFISSR